MSSGAAVNTLLKQIYINSSPAYRDVGGTDEDFTITENGHHFGPPIAPKRVKLASATIPYTWYNTTSSNNQFNFTDTNGTFTITIPPANYDGMTLASTIQGLMNAASDQGYAVTLSMQTFKYTIAGNGNFSLDFTGPNSAASLLGFFAGTVTTPAPSVTAPNMVGLIPDPEIFICTDLVSGCDNGLIVWTPDPVSNSNRGIIAKVSISACYGSYINYCGCETAPFFDARQSPYVTAAMSTATPLPPRVMRFWLEFPSGLPVDLNGNHWSAALIFDFGSEVNI